MSTTIRAISLWQPWATLMAIGAKTNETRSWSTNHRGPLAIQAAKRWTKPQREFCRHPRLRKALERAQIFAPDLLPRGAILCVVDLVDVVSTNECNLQITADELCFGEYDEDRYIWRTENLRRLAKPLPWRGAQGLFEVQLPDLEV